MTIAVSIFLVLVLLFVVRCVHCALLSPLPPSVRCVFRLDARSEGELEYALRGYRFLRRHGWLSGDFVIELADASEEGQRAASLLARAPDVTVSERDPW